MPGHGWAMQSAPDTSLPSITFPCRFKHRKDDQVNTTGTVIDLARVTLLLTADCQGRTTGGENYPLVELLHAVPIMTPHPLRPAAQQISESCDSPECNASKGDSKDMLSSQRMPGMRLAGKCPDPCLPLSLLLTARFPYETVYGGDYMLSCLTEH